jgi:toxin FitB
MRHSAHCLISGFHRGPSGIVSDLLVDTDIFIDHLRGARRFAPGDNSVAYSVVTRCELFAGSRTDETAVRHLLDPFMEFPIERAVAERAGRIRRQFGVKIADALIAATALEYSLILVTRNIRHFDRINDLRLQPAR